MPVTIPEIRTTFRTSFIIGGNRTVNYLSLDIEGAELQVLQAIPWAQVDIEVITVETNHAGEVFPGKKLLYMYNVHIYTVCTIGA